MDYMTVEEIKKEYDILQQKLVVALSTMEKKSTIFDLRCAISQLQDACPHMDEKGTFNLIEGHCPYCNKKL